MVYNWSECVMGVLGTTKHSSCSVLTLGNKVVLYCIVGITEVVYSVVCCNSGLLTGIAELYMGSEEREETPSSPCPLISDCCLIMSITVCCVPPSSPCSLISDSYLVMSVTVYCVPPSSPCSLISDSYLVMSITVYCVPPSSLSVLFSVQHAGIFSRTFYTLHINAFARVQELCESRGGRRPGLSVLMSLTPVSVDVKQHWTVLRHWSKFVPNMSRDIRGHEALLHHHVFGRGSQPVFIFDIFHCLVEQLLQQGCSVVPLGGATRYINLDRTSLSLLWAGLA